MSIEDDILIERFINGTLTPEEEKIFSERVKTDAAFRESVRIEKELFKTFNEAQWSAMTTSENKEELEAYKTVLLSDDTQNLKKTLSQVNEDYQNRTKTRDKKNWYFYSAVAALLLVFLAVYFNINSSASTESLYANYLETSELPSLVSRNSSDDELYKAESAYDAKQYEQALASYTQLIKTSENNKTALYLYKGVSEMQLNKFADAEKTFDAIIASESLDATKGYWYKALLYLKMKDIDQTSEILELIIKNKYFNDEEATTLLQDLNKSQRH